MPPIKTLPMQAHGAAFLSPGSGTLLVTQAKAISLITVADGTIKPVKKGYTNLSGIVPTADAKAAYVTNLDAASKNFGIYLISLAGSALTKSKLILKGAGQPMQLALLNKDLLYVDQIAGNLVAVDTATKKTKVLLSGLSSPVGLLLSADNKKAFITESGSGEISSFTFSTAKKVVLLSGLTQPRYLSYPDGKPGNTLLFTDATAGVSLHSFLTTGIIKKSKVTPLDGAEPIGAWQAGKFLAAAELKRWLIYDLRKLRLPVGVTIEDAQPFIGTYQRVRLNFGTSGLTMDKVDLRIITGEAGGQFSYAQDDLSAANEAMLLVGYRPGVHTIEVINKATNAVAGLLNYRISQLWSDENRSPAQWVVGQLEDFTTGYTWGGGPGVAQNGDVFPQSGARTIAIVMVDVSDARYPTGAGLTTIETEWVNGAVGTTPDGDGKVRSAKAYYEEVSHTTFTLSLAAGQALNVALPNAWTDYFKMMPSPWPGNSFKPKDGGAFAQAVISDAAAQTDGGGNPLIDFQHVQTLIMVVRSQGPAGTDNFFWPQAWGGAFTVPGGSSSMRVLGMPDDWNPVRTSRTIYETLSHELGHNLGYPDLYTNANPDYSASIQARDVTDFDLMSAEARLPHMSVGQKLETGWVRPEWVFPFDFSRSTVPRDQTLTLQAIELGAPPAGQFAAAEVRIADGWNYYFEYRARQLTQIGDQSLHDGGNPDNTEDNVVLGTDMVSAAFNFPIARPQIIRLRRDAENENSFFKAGENYKETDNSGMAIADFQMDVLSTNATSAQIRIRYGTNGRPDLYIRPWPGGDNWQSPDIEVRNVRAQADPGHWANMPWVGHPNTVVARFRNRGPVTATNVTVNFYIMDFTVGGAPKVFLGSDTHDVPPETSTPFVEFTTPWTPNADGHKCIIASTELYIDTSVNPNIVELTDSNNMAQSNYTRYIPATASPARRLISDVSLHNPFSERATIFVIPQIRGLFAKYYRLYLEHSALELDPNETRKVKIMIETQYGDPRLADIWKQYGERIVNTEVRMSLTGYGLPPHSPGHPVLLGGVQMNVATGRATKFDYFKLDDNKSVLMGRVITVDNGSPAPGNALVTFHTTKDSIAHTIQLPLDANGAFIVREILPLIKRYMAIRISAHYYGRPGFGPSDGDDIAL